MKKIPAKILSLLTVMSLLMLLTLNSFAEDACTEAKEENVYVNLNYNGSPKGIYVVNHYSLAKNKTLLDYGNYINLKNLTTSASVKPVGKGAKINASKGEFYFQGTLKKAVLPWDIYITYYLDGKEIQAESLAGKSGHLEIVVEVYQNKNGNSYFFNNFAVQVNLQLNTLKCRNIEADGASLSNYAKNKKIQFTILPGKEKQVKVSADVKNFEMDGIAINSGAFSLKIDSPNLSSFMDSIYLLQSSIGQVDSGTGELKNGVSSLSGGVSQIQQGSKLILDGMSQLDSNTDVLTKGSGDMKDALNTINTEVTKFVDPIERIYNIIKGTGIGDGLEAAIEKVIEIQNKYDGYKGLLEKKGLTDDVINALISDSENISADLAAEIANLETTINELKALNVNGSNSQQITNLTAILERLKTTLTDVNSFFEKTSSRLSKDEVFLKDVYSTVAEMESILDVLEKNINTILKLVENIPTIIDNYANSLFALRDSIQLVYSEYARLDQGINDYTDGFTQIVKGYCSFYSGITMLNNGALALQDGATRLNSGTNQLNTETAGIDTMVNEKVGSMIQSILGGTNQQLPSFVSESNTKVKAVQFAMTTPEIKKAEKVSAQPQEIRLSFWQRLLALFGIGK